MESRVENLEGQLAQLQQQQAEFNQSLMAIMARQFEELKRELQIGAGKEKEKRQLEEIESSASKDGTSKIGSNPRDQGNLQNSGSKMHRVEFPKFFGENPMQWIRKCNKYFQMNYMSETEKIDTAAMYMEGRADLWYLEYVEGMEGISWGEFGKLVIERFSNAEGVNLIAQFNKLRQTSDVMSYTFQFEELKAFMVSDNRQLKESYFVQSYISGLNDDIARMVEMFNPSSLKQAIQLARKQELQLVSMKGESRQMSGFISLKEGSGKSNESNKAAMFKKLTPTEIEERRKKKLCFNCDEPYQWGHKCKKLFVIICEDNQETELLLQEVESEEEEIMVSVHALMGQVVADTIKIKGKVGKQEITILIDKGSTHSFLDQMTAKRLKCEMEYTNPLRVTVADGGKLECNTRCPKLEWEMGKYRFSTSIRILQLGGCDMVIGVDLLKQWEPVTFNFTDQNIRFTSGGTEVVLQGIKKK